MKNKKSFFDTFDTSRGKIITNTDEQTDMQDEKPDDGENPDEKTKSKNKNILIKQTEDSSTSNKKRGISMDINEIEKAWQKNKASDPEETVMENIEMTKASIKSIVRHANALATGLNESNQSSLSEGWIQAKITIIEDYLKAVHDYVMYYEEEKESEDVE
jgi:hypothetical protein